MGYFKESQNVVTYLEHCYEKSEWLNILKTEYHNDLLNEEDYDYIYSFCMSNFGYIPFADTGEKTDLSLLLTAIEHLLDNKIPW